MHRIPAHYRRYGLTKVLRVREHSRCEASIRLTRGKLLGGTLNVESPVEGGLMQDLEFLKSCGAVLSDLLTRMDSSGDRAGLSEIAVTHLHTHAIKDMIMKWQPGDAQGASTIVERLQRRILPKKDSQPLVAETTLSLHASTIDTVQDLNRGINRMLDDRRSAVVSERPIEELRWGSIPPDFPLADLSSLVVIIGSILDNIKAHSLLAHTNLEMSVQRGPASVGKVLSIVWKSERPLPQDIDRDTVCLAPIHRVDGPHFGLFLIGVHARLLGGTVEFSENRLRNGTPGPFRLHVWIPYLPIPKGKN